MKKLHYILILLTLLFFQSMQAWGQMHTSRVVVDSGSTVYLASSGTYTAPPVDEHGGALSVASGGTAILTGNITFANNESIDYHTGGAILANGFITGNGYTLTLINNTAHSRGGGIAAGNLFFDGNIVGSGNYALSGGAICAEDDLTIIGNVELTNNTANGSLGENGGGAIRVTGEAAALGSANSVIILTDNQAPNSIGGAIMASADDSCGISLTGSMIDISRNSAGYYGGAILNTGDVTFNLTAGGTMSAVGNNSGMGIGGFMMSLLQDHDANVNFNIGAGAVATIGDANTIADNIANGTDSIFGYVVGEESLGLVKNGDGTLVLNQSNIYNGNTELNGGKTVVNGVLYSEMGPPFPFSTVNTGTTHVNAGATLAGSGTINGLVEVKNGGTFTPGREDGSFATFTVNSLTIESGGILGATLTGTGYTDALVTVADTLTLDPNGTIALIFDGGFIYGAGIEYSFTIFNADALSGVTGSDYLSLVDWSNLNPAWQVLAGSASFEDGVLKFGLETIPEPGTWALMLGGVGVLGYLQRVRRRNIS